MGDQTPLQRATRLLSGNSHMAEGVRVPSFSLPSLGPQATPGGRLRTVHPFANKMQGDSYRAIWAKLYAHLCLRTMGLTMLRPGLELCLLSGAHGHAPAHVCLSQIYTLPGKLRPCPMQGISCPFSPKDLRMVKNTHIHTFAKTLRRTAHVSITQTYVSQGK